MKHLWFEKGAYANKKARDFVASKFNPLTIKKIAVIRHAALGDQVITRPFLVEVKKFFPNAKVTLSVVSNYQYGMPDDLCDELHIIHGSEMKSNISFREKINNFKSLEKQDIIFDLAATNRSYWLTFFSDAKLKIGFPYGHWTARFLYDIALLRSDFTAEVEVMLDFLRMLGHAPNYPLDFAYPNNALLIEQQKPYIVYFNGASQESKMYPSSFISELLTISATALPEYQHVFLEGLNEQEKATQLTNTPKNNISIQTPMSLDKLIHYISQASVVVSTDTGIRNIAISTHTPTVGIFYSTVPFRYTPLYDTHKIVMNANATIPKPNDVLTCLKNLL